jgi:hypothetical protein
MSTDTKTDPGTRARGIHALLSQASVWVDRQGRRHDVASMSVRYKRHVVGFLERGARIYGLYYQLGRTSTPLGFYSPYVIGHDADGNPVESREQIYVGPSELSLDLIERDERETDRLIEADPVAWLRSTPLVARLLADIDAGRGGTDGDAEHQAYVETQAQYAHGDPLADHEIHGRPSEGTI